MSGNEEFLRRMAAAGGNVWDMERPQVSPESLAPRILPSQETAVAEYRRAAKELKAAQWSAGWSHDGAKNATQYLDEARRDGSSRVAEYAERNEAAQQALENARYRVNLAFEAVDRAREAARAVGVQNATFAAINAEVGLTK